MTGPLYVNREQWEDIREHYEEHDNGDDEPDDSWLESAYDEANGDIELDLETGD